MGRRMAHAIPDDRANDDPHGRHESHHESINESIDESIDPDDTAVDQSVKEPFDRDDTAVVESIHQPVHQPFRIPECAPFGIAIDEPILIAEPQPDRNAEY